MGAVLRIQNVYPGSRILIFTHPGSRIQKQQQKRGVKRIFCHTFLCSHKFHKIENYFSFVVLNKKNWANFQRLIELFTKKIVIKLSKRWVWDPGSEIRKKPIPDPGSMGQKGTGSRIPEPGSGSSNTGWEKQEQNAGERETKKEERGDRKTTKQH